jgi:hypothetical protein
MFRYQFSVVGCQIAGGVVAVQAPELYISPMRIIFVLPLALAACALPGRQNFSPRPVGADTAAISSADAFAGRIPLLTILPGTTDFGPAVANAVRQALAVKPAAAFEVQAQSPVASTPDAGAAALTGLSGTAAAVASAIVSDGVPASRVSLTAKTAGLDADILVFVK